MRTKNFFVVKLVAVTMMLGFFSPSITIQESATPEKMASAAKLDISEELFARFSTTDISISLFTQAEARKHKRKKYNKNRRKAIRKGHRRSNYRHHRKSERRRNVVGAVVGAAVVGAVVNEVVSD